ncbi:7-carboxy-7-deazaguanine synthase QueE [Elusimicrobiota bacterium]
MILQSKKAPVSEIFFSYQGEGIYAGLPQIFVRFVGCNLQCSYCDTEYAKQSDAKTKYYTQAQVYRIILKIYKKNKKSFFGNNPSVSLTGGEPLVNADFLTGLLKLLKKDKFNIYLETNGSLPEQLNKIARYCDVVSMDIKLKSACKKDLLNTHKKFLKIVKDKTFVKIVVSKDTKRHEFISAVDLVSKDIKLVIQPDTNGKNFLMNIFEFYNLATKKIKDVRILPQMHKIWKVR